jgi:hypothetical protein
MYVMLAINSVHSPGIKEDQQHKDVDRPLLRKPEPKFESTDTNCVEFLDE